MTIPLPPECPPAATRYTDIAEACAEADRWHAQFHLVIQQRDELRASLQMIRAAINQCPSAEVLPRILEIAEHDPVRAQG